MPDEAPDCECDLGYHVDADGVGWVVVATSHCPAHAPKDDT